VSAGLLLGAALAQEPGLSLLFLVNDPEGLLQGDPQLTLTDAAGMVSTYSPRDNGVLPDIAEGDALYAQPILGLQSVQVEVMITDGQRSWQDSSIISTDSKTPMLLVELGADGSLAFSDSPPASVGPEDGGERPEIVGSDARAQMRWGYWLWAALMTACGVVLARGLLRLKANAQAPARLAVEAPVVTSRRISTADLDAVCAALVESHRVVVVGPAQPGTIACLDAHPLPGEVVAAVEALALSPGRSPALLVTDPSQLAPGADPVAALERRVAGRFPLVVVAAP
jgi:hypothetical protein